MGRRPKKGINIIPKNREHAEYLEWLQRQRIKDKNRIRRLYYTGKQLCKNGVSVDGDYVTIMVYVNYEGDISYHVSLEVDCRKGCYDGVVV